MAQFAESAFRAYDVRGVINQEITPGFMEALGRAFVTAFGATEVVVGYDARPSSKEFLPHLLKGIATQGADVRLVGMVPSELVIATAGLENIKNAAIITASHNPAEYIGVKLYTNTSEQVSVINYQAKVKEIMLAGNFPSVKKQGEVQEWDPWPAYTKHVLSVIDLPKLSPRHILADAGNGTGGMIINHLKDKLNLTVDEMFFEPDGTYPNHVPNPILPESREAAEAKAKTGNYDFSVLFDGDGDRVIFLDENGNHIFGDFIGTLIADEIIHKKYPESPIVIDIRRGWVTQDSGKTNGYEVIATIAGNPYLKKAMREHNGAYGFEASAHNFYKDFFMSDTSGVTLVYMLYLLETTGKKLSELVAPYQSNHFMIDETNYVHSDAQAAFALLKEHYNDAEIKTIDGLSIDYPDWHANLRASNTEPLIRLNLEARDKTVMEQKFQEVDSLIKQSGGEIQVHSSPTTTLQVTPTVSAHN